MDCWILGFFNISPRFGGGSGLKLGDRFLDVWFCQVISPRFGGGSGLKQNKFRPRYGREEDLPSLRRGERIETRRWTAGY